MFPRLEVNEVSPGEITVILEELLHDPLFRCDNELKSELTSILDRNKKGGNNCELGDSTCSVTLNLSIWLSILFRPILLSKQTSNNQFIIFSYYSHLIMQSIRVDHAHIFRRKVEEQRSKHQTP